MESTNVMLGEKFTLINVHNTKKNFRRTCFGISNIHAKTGNNIYLVPRTGAQSVTEALRFFGDFISPRLQIY